jgi:hypothetical protein
MCQTSEPLSRCDEILCRPLQRICLEDEIYGGHKNGGFELRIGFETTKSVLKAVLTLGVCSNMSTSKLVMEENHERRKHSPRVESKVPTVRIGFFQACGSSWVMRRSRHAAQTRAPDFRKLPALTPRG